MGEDPRTYKTGPRYTAWNNPLGRITTLAARRARGRRCPLEGPGPRRRRRVRCSGTLRRIRPRIASPVRGCSPVAGKSQPAPSCELQLHPGAHQTFRLAAHVVTSELSIRPEPRDTTSAHGSLTRECGLWGQFAQRQEVRPQIRPQSVGPKCYSVLRNAINARLSSAERSRPNGCPLTA
jgi:hypothetical protein